MSNSPIIIAAVIGAVSTIMLVLIKDIGLHYATERVIRQRWLLKHQIEQAYGPLEYLIFALLRAEDEQAKTRIQAEISAILRQYSYLLSEPVTSALFLLLDDEEGGVLLLQPQFDNEFDMLKKAYYRMLSTQRLPSTRIWPSLGRYIPRLPTRDATLLTRNSN